MPLGHVTNDIFVILHRVAHASERREADVDLGLAGGSDLVMLALDRNSSSLEFEAHFVANVLQRIHRRHREVTFLRPNLVAEIRKFFAPAIPMSLDTIDVMKRRVDVKTEPDVVENEKFRLWPKEGGVGNASALQICFCFLSDAARVAIIGLARDRIDNRAN